ncbi:Mu-like prophage FluMu F protein [Alteromonas sp. KUL49]|nr:phage head morphogenesis protein [Alteromonas sp. KUL49]GEA13746.1 Mu-like prophage FluMu F protein [Alteromonas sp. KUL49]
MSDIQVGSMPFREAIKHFQEKLLIPSRQWDDLLGPVNAKAFTVAGANKLDIVSDFYESIRSLVESGGTLNDFRKDFDNIVAKHGWSYNGKRGWRTRVILQTNKNSSYMAGKWEQMWRVREARPFLQYKDVGDERVRESHHFWNNKVFPIDHPIWKVIYPPNDWLCRCNVRSLSTDDMEEEGLSVSKADIPEKIEVTDPQSGEVRKTHKGIGVGWDYNVGREWLAPEALFGQKLMLVPSDLREAALDNLDLNHFKKPFKSMVNKVAYQIAKGKVNASGNVLAAGYISNQVLEELFERQVYPVGLAVVAKDADIAHMLRSTKSSRGATVPMSVASEIPDIVTNPDAVLWDKEDPALIYVRRLANGQYAKFVIRLNIKTKMNVAKVRFNEALNAIKTAGIVKWEDLNAARYELITGDISR